MTTQDDLRAAAERLKRLKAGEDVRSVYPEFPLSGPGADRLLLSEPAIDAYLATLDERPISPEALMAVGFVQKKVGLGVYEHPSGLTAYSDDGKFFAWSHGLYDLKPQHMGDVNYILSRLARG